MARLIDADELKKAVEDFPNCYNGWSDAYDKAFIIGAIEEAPTIDAVSVVRCGECKYGLYTDHNKCYMCNMRGFLMYNDADFFCSYGQKERASDDERGSKGVS